MKCAYCVAIVFVCLHVFFIFVARNFNLIFGFFIDGMCMVALAFVVKITSGTTFHSFVLMLSMSGWYFVFFIARANVANLSLLYVNL